MDLSSSCPKTSDVVAVTTTVARTLLFAVVLLVADLAAEAGVLALQLVQIPAGQGGQIQLMILVLWSCGSGSCKLQIPAHHMCRHASGVSERGFLYQDHHHIQIEQAGKFFWDHQHCQSVTQDNAATQSHSFGDQRASPPRRSLVPR